MHTTHARRGVQYTVRLPAGLSSTVRSRNAADRELRTSRYRERAAAREADDGARRAPPERVSGLYWRVHLHVPCGTVVWLPMWS